MDIAARYILIAALILFLLSLFGGKRWIYAGSSVLAAALLFSVLYHPKPRAEVASEEMHVEGNLIDQASSLARRAHTIIDDIPRTRKESLQAQSKDGEVAKFVREEQVWLTNAEHGKSLDAFVDNRASTAAIRIVAADSFLTGAVESAVMRCNDHDSALNMSMADSIIADARATLVGRGNPHFPTPDLSRKLDDSDNCIDDTASQ